MSDFVFLKYVHLQYEACLQRRGKIFEVHNTHIHPLVSVTLGWCHYPPTVKTDMSSPHEVPLWGWALTWEDRGGFSTTCLEWGWSGWAVSKGVHKVHTVPDCAPPYLPSYPLFSSLNCCLEAGPLHTHAQGASEVALSQTSLKSHGRHLQQLLLQRTPSRPPGTPGPVCGSLTDR